MCTEQGEGGSHTLTLSHAASLSGSSLYRNVVDTCMGGATAWCELRWSPAWIARAASESCFSSFFFVSFFCPSCSCCCCCRCGAVADKSWCAICSMTSPRTVWPSGPAAALLDAGVAILFVELVPRRSFKTAM